MNCNVFIEKKFSGFNKQNIQKIVFFLFKKFFLNKGEVSIHLVGATEMRKLNRQYRHKNKITDVISFSAREGFNLVSDQDLGDIFICPPQVIKQAQDLQVDFKEEFLRMLIHGFLHLLGYDHQTLKQDQEMLSLQEKLLKKSLILLKK